MRPVAVLVAAVSALAAALFVVGTAYEDRTLPGLTVAGVRAGSLDADALRPRLAAQLAEPMSASRLTVRVDGVPSEWTASFGELGVIPDVDRMVNAALAYGREGSSIDRLLAWFDALRGDARTPLVARASGPAAAAWIAGIAAATDRGAADGLIARTGEGLAVHDPVRGRSLDRAAALAAVLAASGPADRDLTLTTTVVRPAIDEGGFGEAARLARSVAAGLEITAAGRSVAGDGATLAALLVVERRPDRYVASIDAARLDRWLASAADALDRPVRSATYQESAQGALTVVPSEDGIRVDRVALRRAVLSVLTGGPEAGRVIDAPLDREWPTFTTADAERSAASMIPVSSFATSYPANWSRHANIATGARQFDGVVVAPGATFSFWDLLGPVSVDRGYAYAGAIIDNRSDEDVIGGGLCQVSTTLFNAVARAGFEIVERHAHGYLIERYPVGLDAAVFQPGEDFRWRNDTPFAVFVRTSSTATSVAFELWSVPTGRVVRFGDARQSNFVEPGPTQRPDPAFAAGYTVPGRDVVRTRTVTDSRGAVLHDDRFASHYAPVWGGPAVASAATSAAP